MDKAIKKTKAMYFAELRDLVVAAVDEEELQDEYLDFIDKQIEALDKRKVAAAARAQKKRAESDDLTDAIFEQITEDLATVDEIVLKLDIEGVTRSKVTARLGKLVKAGSVIKEFVRVDGKKKTAYRLPTDEDAAEVSED